MTRFTLLFMLLAQVGFLSAANHDYSVEGGGKAPFEYTDPNVSNISAFIVDGMAGAKITYKSFSNVVTKHEWVRYNSLGQQEPVVCEQEGSKSWIVPEEGYGYFVKTQNDAPSYCIWIIDYSQRRAVFNSLKTEAEEGKDYCETLWLSLDADVPDLKYYTLLGRETIVQRKFTVEYTTLEWNEKDGSFDEVVAAIEFKDGVSASIDVPAPLTSTEFTLKTDNVSTYFGAPATLITEAYKSIAAKGGVAEPVVTDSKDKPAGGSGTAESPYTGSAPITAVLTAYGSEAVNVFDWKMYKLENYPGLEEAKQEGDVVEWEFKGKNDYVVELVARNNFTCIDTTAQFYFRVTDSELEIPNAFSPGTTPGKNDIFRVKAYSIVKFEGAIFSRWGVKVFEWKSPDDGWDGKYNGRYVPAGVYYYVIRAVGSDGTKYNKQGDINVLRPRTINDKLPDEAEPK